MLEFRRIGDTLKIKNFAFLALRNEGNGTVTARIGGGSINIEPGETVEIIKSPIKTGLIIFSYESETNFNIIAIVNEYE